MNFGAESMFVRQTSMYHAADVWKEHVTLFKSIYDRALLRKEAFYTSHFVQIVMGRRVYRAAYVEGRRGVGV